MNSSSRNRRTDAAARRALALPDIISGKGAREVADLHDVSESTVRRWMLEVKEDLLEQGQETILAAGETLAAGVKARLDRLEKLCESDDDKIALPAIFGWLDRAGVVKTERREIVGAGGEPLIRVVITTVEREEILAKRGGK